MTETTMSRSSWRGVQRWVWPVLIGSLALNVAIAGLMLGHRLRHERMPPPGIAARLAQEASIPLMRDLSPEKRAQVRRIFETHRGQNRALWQAVRERRTEVTRVLESEPFDKVAYVASMTRLIEAEAKARSAAQPTFAEVAAALSAKERQDFLATHRQLRQQLLGPAREGQTRGDGHGRRERPADGPDAKGPPGDRP